LGLARLVFDAKAKYNGVSLKGNILDSPNQMNDLSLILTRMRRFKFLFAGDITEMFLQISLAVSDRPFHFSRRALPVYENIV